MRHHLAEEKIPELFRIGNNTCIIVEEIAHKGWRLSFSRWMDVPQKEQYRRLRGMISSLALSHEKDTPKWYWDARGIFTVKNSNLCTSIPRNPHAKLWKAKIPLKTKIFMWQIENELILTRDILSRRVW